MRKLFNTVKEVAKDPKVRRSVGFLVLDFMHAHDLNDILKAGSKLREYFISRKKIISLFLQLSIERIR